MEAAKPKQSVKTVGNHSNSLPEDAEINPLSAAIFYFQARLASRARLRPNPPCSAPYFFKDQSNPKQRSCSPECADWVRRDNKRRWLE
jgi:hypothetical protein